MLDLDKKFQIAAVALNALEDHHRAFMRNVSDLNQPQVIGAELKVLEGELYATCLGVQLAAKHRPIARKGELELIEYPFVAQSGDRELVIWSMFLEDDHLYADLSCSDLICQASNKYLTSRVAPRLSASPLCSTIFAPRSGT